MAGAAYVEGWGLYCERLADEMGLYLSDDRERLGHAGRAGVPRRRAWSSTRACMPWAGRRERAIEFMHERGSLPMVDAEIEVDRYTVWPGQALPTRSASARSSGRGARCREKMGDRFDLRAFHDEVLGHGSLPLATLRREIPGWVEAAVAAREGAPAG